jgi:hypothetical protein
MFLACVANHEANEDKKKRDEEEEIVEVEEEESNVVDTERSIFYSSLEREARTRKKGEMQMGGGRRARGGHA